MLSQRKHMRNNFFRTTEKCSTAKLSFRRKLDFFFFQNESIHHRSQALSNCHAFCSKHVEPEHLFTITFLPRFLIKFGQSTVGI